MTVTESNSLIVGLSYTECMSVKDKHTVPHVARDWEGFMDMPPVFATAMMNGFVEQTCIQAIRLFLSAGYNSVGTHIDISHSAPTPAEDKVSAKVELVSVEGRKLMFSVVCRDTHREISRGTHERAIINVDVFLKRLKRRNPNV